MKDLAWLQTPVSAAIAPAVNQSDVRFCKPCLDFSVRRPHLDRVLGRALLDKFIARLVPKKRRDASAHPRSARSHRVYSALRRHSFAEQLTGITPREAKLIVRAGRR